MVNPDPTVIYDDVQTRKPWAVWLVIVSISAGALALFLTQVVFERPVGSPPMPNIAAWFIGIGVGLMAPLIVALIRLTIIVRADEVVVRYRPLTTRRFAVKDIQSVEAVTYRPLRHWGGWGIRVRPGTGWCYTLSGNQGVMLTLRGGRKRLLGATDAEALARAIEGQMALAR